MHGRTCSSPNVRLEPGAVSFLPVPNPATLKSAPVNFDDPRLPQFLATQIHECGGNVELDAGLWLLFVVEAADAGTNTLTRSLLAEAPFPHACGISADDNWMLYYVDTPNRPAAVHWVHDLQAIVSGQIRSTSPAHRALLEEIINSNMPHRLAQRAADLHTRGELGAGAIVDPNLVRALLDRWHTREPLAFAASLTLLSHNLVDMVVLLQKLIPEDVELLNEIVRGQLSRDPFLQSRQDAAAQIRNVMTRFHVINPLDQQRNTSVVNPYAAFLDIVRNGDQITASIDGTATMVMRDNFLSAIRATRRQLYRGQQFDQFDTQAPWMTDDIAYSFRFIKQRLAARRDLTPIDGLYMLERAV